MNMSPIALDTGLDLRKETGARETDVEYLGSPTKGPFLGAWNGVRVRSLGKIIFRWQER